MARGQGAAGKKGCEATTPVEGAFDGRVTGPEQAEREEALLGAARESIRVAVVDAPFVSWGVSQRPPPPLVAAAAGRGLASVHRSTGGLGVLVGAGDLLWTLVLARRRAVVGSDFVRAYGRLGQGVTDCLSAHGVAARWTAPAGRATDYCLLGNRGQVLAVAGQALGGAAQHLRGGVLLHHGSIARRLDRTLFPELFRMPPAGWERTLTSLEELGVETGPEELGRELLESLVAALGTGEGSARR